MTCYNAFIQDLYGKEAYLKLVNLTWVNMSPWIWAATLVVLMGAMVAENFGEYTERKKRKRALYNWENTVQEAVLKAIERTGKDDQL